MKTNRLKYQLSVMIAVLMLIAGGDVLAQKKRAKLVEVSSTIVDELNNPIMGAHVLSGEGASSVQSGADGSFTIKVQEGSVILIEAPFYEDYVWSLSKDPAKSELIMIQAPLYAGQNDDVHLPVLLKEKKRNVVGAITEIDGDLLEKYHDPLLSNALQGLGMGLIVRNTTGGLAGNSASLIMRGLSRGGSDGIITIVDGIERPIDDVNASAVESVTLLKDATAKILYGSRAANGVLMITTKRGEAHKRVLTTKVDYGVGQPLRLPDFLNSRDYAELYNEARVNDGLAPVYSQDDLTAYENSTGENDLLHPDVDYYDYFLKNYTTSTKVTTEFSGGNNNAQYAVNLGYLGYKGIQSQGPTPRQDRFNIRGNLDAAITENIRAFMDLGTIIDFWKTGGYDHSSTFTALSTHRPNEYPLLIDESLIPPTSRGIPAFGASQAQKSNLLGELAYGGDRTDNFVNAQMNFGLDFDLNKLAEGLTASAFVSFDQYFFARESITPRAPTYMPRVGYSATGQPSDTTMVLMQKEIIDKDYNVDQGAVQTSRRIGYSGQVGYDHKVGVGQLNSTLGYFYFQKEQTGYNQDIKNSNLFLKNNYNVDNKYIAELDLALMGSNRFDSGNKSFFSYALGAGWVMSEEDFLKDVSAIDYLKAKASFGVLGYDATTSYFLHENRYSDGGNVNFGEENKGSSSGVTNINMIANPGLEWEQSREINVGIEGLALDRRLAFEFNYFNTYRSNKIEKVGSEYSAVYGGLYPYTNFGETAMNGFEGEVMWHDNIGDFSYSAGANFVYSKNEQVVKDEIEYNEEYRRTEGLPSDVIMGYRYLGLYGKDVALDGNAPHQTFGEYQEGDMAYEDLNGDGIVNSLDVEEIGNSFPRVSLGVNLDVKYKNWGLYMLGAANLNYMNSYSNTYYRNYGEGKYSTLASDRYHAVNNPTGEQPRLSSVYLPNNSVGSEFWYRDASFFRLKTLEVSYTFNNVPLSIAQHVKLYATCNNAFVISKEKDGMDVEVPNSGVTNYPLMRTFTAGVSVNF